MGLHLLDLVVESVSEPSVGRALFAAGPKVEVYFWIVPPTGCGGKARRLVGWRADEHLVRALVH
jgi:hypothetical protein